MATRAIAVDPGTSSRFYRKRFIIRIPQGLYGRRLFESFIDQTEIEKSFQLPIAIHLALVLVLIAARAPHDDPIAVLGPIQSEVVVKGHPDSRIRHAQRDMAG